MAYATYRVILFDRNMLPLDEIGPDEIFSRVRTEEINGEHSLVLVTTRRLQEGWRALTVDGTGKWREWVVNEIDEEHASGRHALGTYHLVWSLQYDLTMTYTHTHTEIGYGNATKTAQGAATLVCQETNWVAGDGCDAPNVPEGSGAVFIYESAWSKLSKTVECMSCEVDADIRVNAVAGSNYNLTTPFYVERYLNLRAHIGSQTALRRFDWSEDLTSIKRIPDPGPYYCRVVPLGKRKDAKPEYAYDDKTTFDWPLDITEETGTKENPGPYYIEDPEAALAFRRMNSAGTWVYPTKAVKYDEDDPELLLSVAQDDLHNHTRPGVTYEADVLQLAQAGMDVQGVALGDEVQIVDYGFNPDAGLRIQGRVIKIEVDELSPETTTKLTIGQLRDSITDTINNALSDLSTSISSTSSTVSHMTTSDYIDELIDRINAEINAGGGYTYLVPGEGLIVYNTEVADPLIGDEAESVVQIKDGSIRIANSRKTQFGGIDDWNWKSVFQSGLIATDVLSATNIITGIIEDAAHRLDQSTGDWWNLDTGEMNLSGNFTLDIPYVASPYTSHMITKNGALNLTVTKYIFNGQLRPSYTETEQYSTYGMVVANRHEGAGSSVDRNIYIVPNRGLPSSQSAAFSAILCDGPIEIQAHSGITGGLAYLRLSKVYGTELLAIDDTGSGWGMHFQSGMLAIGRYANFSGHGRVNFLRTGTNVSDHVYFNDDVDFHGDITVSGTKPRLVNTENYGDRLLFCYETPSPMFGDLGSGVIEDDGYCYILIDDVFSETARTDYTYQVFLQQCGDGKLWVEDKQPSYFVVKGTPGLKFDWELKAHQKDYENLRLDDFGLRSGQSNAILDADESSSAVEGIYGNDFISEMEEMFDTEISSVEKDVK